MSDYTQVNQYTFRDTLLDNDPLKIIQGLYFDEEFSAISTAIATKYDPSDMSPIPADPSDADSLMSPAATADMIANNSAVEDFTIGTGADNTNATLYMNAGDIVDQDANEIQFSHGDPVGSPIYAGRLRSIRGLNGLNTTLSADSPADSPWVDFFYGDAGSGGGVEQITTFQADPDVGTDSSIVFAEGLAVSFEEAITIKDGIEITSGIGSPNYIDGSGLGMLDIGAKLDFIDTEDKEVRINTFDVSTGIQNSTLFQADGNVFFPQDIHVQNQDTPANFYRFSEESGVANLVQFEPPPGQSGEFQIVVRGVDTYTWQFGSDGALWRNNLVVIPAP